MECPAYLVPAEMRQTGMLTAVRNMRRDGVPRVVRMRISGHKTDAMERRYNIADDEDLTLAKQAMENRVRRET